MTEPVSTATQTADARTLRRTEPERALALGRDLYSAALGGGDRRGAADALLTLALCHLDAADYNAAAEHLGEAQALFAALGDGAGEAEVAVLQGVALCRRGDYDGALARVLSGLEGARQLNAEAVEAQALRVAGEVYGNNGNYERSRDLLHRALSAAQSLGDAFEVSETLLHLSRTYRFLGEYEQALRYGLDALAQKRGSGDLLGEAYVLNHLGLIYHDPYDSEQALSYYLQGLALSEKLGNRRSKLVLLGNLAELYDDMGDLERSLDYTRQSLALSEEIGSRHTAGISLKGLGSLYARRGDYDNALAFYGRALELQRDIGDKQGQASTLRYLAELYGATEKSRALACYHQSLALAREIGHPYTEAQVLVSLGGFFSDPQKARECFEDALVLAQRMKLLSLVQKCSRALYELYKSQHDFEGALNHLETLHETTQVLADERAVRTTQRLLVEFELEKTQQAAELQRLRNDELARVNRALHEINGQNIRLLERLREQAGRLQRQATEDSLTGLFNRRYAERQLKREFRRARRYARPLSVAVVDIDNFKAINDRFSHAVGDGVLKAVADILTTSIRPADMAARYGGEEFVLALPETGASGGLAVCEKLRRSVESYPWRDLHPDLQVTVSIGLCSDFNPSYERMLALADDKLYRAKRSGKNRVVT